MKTQIGLAVALALLASGGAVAQTVPYQAAQHGMYGSGLGQEPLPKGGTFVPRLEAAIQYADNINLAQNSKDQVNAAGLELAPGFYGAYNSDTLTAAADYSLIGRAWDESAYNDVSQRLAANGRWLAVPDLISLNGAASYDDAVIDPQQGLNYGGMGIFGAQNLTERATASISPVLLKRFHNFELETSYSYGRVWYLNQGKGQTPVSSSFYTDDSTDQGAKFQFGTRRDGRRLNGDVFYDWQRSDFTQSTPYQFERAGFQGGWQFARTLQLVGDVGRESDLDKSVSQGGLDKEFWSAGLAWSPDPRTTAEARYGTRFFGHSYSGTITHRARLVEFTASYSETPQVETRKQSLASIYPGELPPWLDPYANFGVYTSLPYISKDTRVGVTAAGSRTKVTLNAFETDRNYIDAGFGDEKGTGVSLDATRKAASNLSFDFSARYTDYQRDPSSSSTSPLVATHDYDSQFILRGNREFGPRLVASLEAGYLNRSGSTVYDGWWVGLRGRWSPSLH